MSRNLCIFLIPGCQVRPVLSSLPGFLRGRRPHSVPQEEEPPEPRGHRQVGGRRHGEGQHRGGQREDTAEGQEKAVLQGTTEG